MKITLGFSPCPNDTFIFDALVNRKIDTGEFEFDVVLEDVQTLNRWALEGKLDMSKVSYGVWPLLKDNYSLLDSGGALGQGRSRVADWNPTAFRRRPTGLDPPDRLWLVLLVVRES